jgi:hypothetical protein
MFLKQSTSAVVLVGPVLDASGVAVTTAVIGDFTLSKNGTSTAMSGNTISHSHNGHYAITLTSGNTDTIGRLTISVNNTAQAMPVFRWDICQPTVYDALFTNATNTTGGLPAATAAITALAGAVSTYAGGDTAGTTTLLTAGRVTANTDQWGGVSVTGMPLPTGSYTAPATAGAIADAVWDEAYSGHTTAGSFGKLMDILRKANTVIEGTILASPTPTTTVFRISGADYPTGALIGSVLWMNSGTSQEQNSPIISTTNNGDGTLTVTLENPLVTAPSAGDTVLIDPTSHVHSVAEVATAVRTELAIELGRIDVSISSRLASSVYTAPDNAGIALIKTVTDRLNTGLVQDGAVWQFTVNMLENGPAGGGGGSATVGNQLLILDQLDAIQNKTDLISGASGITSLLAGAILDPGQITSFPETLTIGDSYTEANGRAIQIPVVDTNGVPISSTGSLYFSSATVTFVIKRAGELDSDRIISGTATFVDPPGTGTGDEAPYVVVELSSSETLKGLVKYKYTGILTFTWPGTSDEVMSFETNTITFRE